jgi:hypothetical protein
MCIFIVFLLFYAWHGVIREREFELWAFIGAVIILAVYIFWSFFVTPQTTVKIIRLVFFAAGSVPVVILAYSVSREFRWLEFRIVGADPILQGMYRSYSRCTTLLLFDVQVAASLLVLVYHPKLHASLAEQITIPLLVALTLLMACDVFVGVTKSMVLSGDTEVIKIFLYVADCHREKLDGIRLGSICSS